MKITKKDIMTMIGSALLTGALLNVNACTKEKDDDEDEDTEETEEAVAALTIKLDADCEGEPCM
jgi:hypothetical protein